MVGLVLFSLFFSKLCLRFFLALSWLSHLFFLVDQFVLLWTNWRQNISLPLYYEVSAILRSGRNKTKSKKSKKKKDSANDDTISGASGAADTSSAVVWVNLLNFSKDLFFIFIIRFIFKKTFCFSEEKEDVNQSVESTPQITPIPMNTTAPPQTTNNDQQPEVDEDGYCIQPKDPLWNTQWPKKGKKLKFWIQWNNFKWNILINLLNNRPIFSYFRFRFGQWFRQWWTRSKDTCWNKTIEQWICPNISVGRRITGNSREFIFITSWWCLIGMNLNYWHQITTNQQMNRWNFLLAKMESFVLNFDT